MITAWLWRCYDQLQLLMMIDECLGAFTGPRYPKSVVIWPLDWWLCLLHVPRCVEPHHGIGGGRMDDYGLLGVLQLLWSTLALVIALFG